MEPLEAVREEDTVTPPLSTCSEDSAAPQRKRKHDAAEQ